MADRSGEARWLALQALLQIQQGRNLPDALQAVRPAGNEIPPEWAHTRALCYGSVRYFHRLDAMLAQLLRKPLKKTDQDLKWLLLLGLYQLFYSDKPAHACVNETVKLVRPLNKDWARALVNGVLRTAQRQAETLQQIADSRPASRYSLPDWLWQRLAGDYPEQADTIASALLTQAPMYLRVNLVQSSREAYQQRLEQSGMAASAGLVPTSLLVEQAQAVDALPGFADGACSIQDESAQFASYWLDLAPGQRVLDACAAPGGKTAAMAELQPGLGALHAIDCDPQRQQRTAETCQRLQIQATLKTADAARPETWWDGEPYDRILLDAPCSATGVIRRHPDIKLLRRSADIEPLNQQQRALLEALWPLLRAGGKLLYVTCSLLKSENQSIIRAFLADHSDAVLLPVNLPAGLHSVSQADDPGLQILPMPGGRDGFYFALLGKEGGETA